MSILFCVLIFSLLIFVHELGHFLAAKASGVRVNEFALFMGPAIFKKKVGETTYSLRCIPFGGYCAMEGEDTASEDPRSFGSAAWWKRLIILVAGAVMNFLIGLVLFAVVLGPSKQFIVPVVSEIEAGSSLAGPGGLETGDRLLALDGEAIYLQKDFSMLLSLTEGTTHDLLVERDGEKQILPQVLMEKREFPDPEGGTSLRYGFSFSVVEATVAETLRQTWLEAVDCARIVRLSLAQLFSGRAGLKDMSGPVGIVDQMSAVAEASGDIYSALLNILYFGGFLAVNLGIMNLLPLPALDGGRALCLLLTTAVEAVTHKKLNPKYEAYLHGAGMILLLALMAVITFKDIFTLIRR